MEYTLFSFRNAQVIFENDDRYTQHWHEMLSALDSINDSDIIEKYNANPRASQKSISDAINILIDERLVEMGWDRQSPIFNDSEYRPNSQGHWGTLDFVKGEISVEVAFNHGEATAWNLVKPVLAGELNHVEKAVQTSAGIIITATDSMKHFGNLDGAAGSYEKFLQYLKPFNNILTIPMMIIGLKAPSTFFVNPVSKQVTDISEHIFPQIWVGTEICRILDAREISYRKTTSITRNGNRIAMYIKATRPKIAVLNSTPEAGVSTLLENEGWKVICLDQIHSELDLKTMCEDLRDYET